LSSNVSVLFVSFVIGPSTYPNYTLAGTSRITFATNGYIQVASTQFINANTDIYPQLVSQPSSPIGIMSQSADRKLVLKNPNNQIYQIGRIGTLGTLSVGFDSVACLGIQHPTHIFDSSVTSGTGNPVISLSSEGTGGTLSKGFWASSGTATPSLYLYSNGTSLFKVGLSTETVSLYQLRLNGSMSLLSETSDNELVSNVNAVAPLYKEGSCRWILSGTITTTGATGSVPFSLRDGVLQLPLDKINTSTYTSIAGQTSVDACLEISGTGTVRSTLGITLLGNVVGKNRMGGLRVISGSVTINTLTMNAGAKVAAALNATLILPTFVNNPQNNTLYFGGEGTVDVQFALGGTSTTVSINKEDSGTLKMSTNDKTYAAPTNINAGTLWCDGFNRIGNSNLVMVANGARLRTTASGTTALSVKALTLAAGSTVQVG
jgi:autotransporter-associated beta strand protein